MKLTEPPAHAGTEPAAPAQVVAEMEKHVLTDGFKRVIDLEKSRGPRLAKIRAGAKIAQEETFAPILYLTSYANPEEAIAWDNAAPQGLNSAIFSNDLREAGFFR